MQKSLHIDPLKCTSCLQCEMACSFENYGVFNNSLSRIKVFEFHHTGAKVPYTPVRSVIDALDALQYATMLCNEDGFDPISFGATIGAVMELYEMGVLTKDEIGIEAPFGSAKALTYLTEITARGEGFGKITCLGL